MRGKVVALVTGGGRGIGRGIALALARAGADVAVNYIGNEARAEEVAREIRNMGRRAIASGQVGIGYPNLAHYTASKGGVIALTEGMALELSPLGVNVNAIAPGMIESDMTRDVVADERARAALIARIPKRRIGTPDDVAGLAVFLASDESDYCTGATFYVDGGWLAG